jgi:hypothetical protein
MEGLPSAAERVSATLVRTRAKEKEGVIAAYLHRLGVRLP